MTDEEALAQLAAEEDALKQLMAKGIIDPFYDGSDGRHVTVTRGQLALILSRAIAHVEGLIGAHARKTMFG